MMTNTHTKQVILKRIPFMVLLMVLAFSSFATAPVYRFHRTYSYHSGAFVSSETYFNDISDSSGIIVGYYKNESGGYSGLVYFMNEKTISYDYPGYSNTELTGVNKEGYVVGRAYNAASDAIVFWAQISKDTLANVTDFSYFFGLGNTFKNSKGLNNMNVMAGSFFDGASRWLRYIHLTDISPKGTERYKSGSTFYTTYGTGISDSNEMTGYYLDDNGAFQPFVYSSKEDEMYTFSSVISNTATFFMDINVHNMVAVKYKDAKGFWQGTIAELSYGVISNTAAYNKSFPFKSSKGSGVLGLNNNNDIVGYFTDDNFNTTAYFATVSDYKIPGFTVPEDVFAIANAESVWQEHVDYRVDPYLHTPDPLFKAFPDKMFDNKLEDLNSLFIGYRTPDWISYVETVGESAAYETVAGEQRPKQRALIDWLMLSAPGFKGYCYGMSAFALQHQVDPSVLVTRYPDLHLDIPLPDIHKLNDLKRPKLVPNLKTAIGSLHLYQYSATLWPYEVKGKHLRTLFNERKDVELYDSVKTYVDALSLHFYDKPAYSTCNILGMLISTLDDPEQGGHAVVPYKLSRSSSFTDFVDTLYALDPNLPDSFLRILINYPGHGMVGLNQRDEVVYRVHLLYPIGSLKDLNISQYQNLINEKYVFGMASSKYRIENKNNPAEYAERNDTALINKFPAMLEQYDMGGNDTKFPVRLYTNGAVDTKTFVQAATDSNSNLFYSYPGGNMFYFRSGVLPSETDIVYNNKNHMIIENPDPVKKQVGMGAIFSANGEESTVVIDSMSMSNTDTVSVTFTDQYHLKLTNGEDTSKVYNLYARYMGGSDYFTKTLSAIKISPKTNHTIILRPGNTEHEVIIVVDSLQDGTPDDTLYTSGSGSPTSGIYSLNHGMKVSVYPNPVQQQLLVSMQDFKQGYRLQLSDLTGRILMQTPIESSLINIPMQAYQNGLYLVNIKDIYGNIVFRDSVLKAD